MLRADRAGVPADDVANLFDLSTLQFGIDGERQHFSRDSFRDRKRALAVTGIAIRALQMNRDRIVNAALNIGGLQRLG